MKHYHDYFWSFIKKRFPRAVEAHYYNGLGIDFYPSEETKNLYSCLHDVETGKLEIYTGDR